MTPRLTERLHLGHLLAFGISALLITWRVAEKIKRLGCYESSAIRVGVSSVWNNHGGVNRGACVALPGANYSHCNCAWSCIGLWLAEISAVNPRILAFALMAGGILAVATEYTLSHRPKPCVLTTTSGNVTFGPAQLQFHEMRKSERNQCAGTYVDRRKSMMRCTLPDDGSFIRGEQ